jgi:predicted metalloprotease
VKFNPDADLDTSGVEDLRGSGGGSLIPAGRIQKKAQGRVTPENFSYGTADQRVHWFKTGMASGDLTDCDTWSTDTL